MQLGEALDRSTWSVSASSWCYDTGEIGNITDIKDGKTDTYWHSNWKANGTGIGGSLPEYFIVDLGEVKEISGFGYVPRNGGGNGVCTSYKVYVSETPFDDVTIPATDVSHKDAVKNKTGEVKAGTMSWSGGYKLTDVAFDANVMGRYVLFVTLNSDGVNDANKNKWASCSEFYVYEAYNTKAGLSKEIKELQYVVDNSGVNPGQYKAANSAAIAAAIAKAKAVLDTEGATMTQYGDALNTLKAETNGLVVVNPLEAGYYMIVSGFKAFEEQQKVEKAMYAKAGAPAWKTLDQKDGSQYWQLKAVEGGFALYNLGREKYISGVGALGDETVLKFDNLTTPGDFNIKKGGDVFHALAHNGGAGNEGDITSWGGNSGTASAWVLRKVNYEDILPLVKEGLTEYADAQQATVNGYQGVDPGFLSDISSVTAVIDNAKANSSSATTIKAVVDIREALAPGVQNALNALTKNPVTEGYYQIVSGFKAFEEQQKVEKAMYAKAGAPAWKTLDQKDGSQYWQLKAVEGGFALYNLGREKYISGVGALGDETVLKFDNLTTPGDFNIKKGGDVFHALAHNGGAGNEGDITSWGGNSGTASAWVLRKVNYEDILPLVKEGLTEYADAQQATVNGYQGVDPGFLSDISSVTAVIDNAKANSSSATTIKAVVDIREALAPGVQNALNALTKNPVTEGYYQIVSGYKAFKEKQGVEKAMSASATAPAWGTLNGNDATQYWYLKQVEGGFTAYNVGREAYIAGKDVVSDAAATLTFADLSGYGEFNIKLGANMLHANSHSEGAGVGSNIVYWSNGANSPSSWMLRRVEDIEALKPAFVVEARKLIMAAIAKVDVNALNGVNPGQIADTEALNNLLETSTANANAETNVKALLDMEGSFNTSFAALLNKIDTKKYYRIKNKKYGHYIGWKEGTSNTVKMNDDDKTAVDQLWQFVESNGKFKLLNVNAGTYLANVAEGKGSTTSLNAGGADYTVSVSNAPAFEILDGGKPVQEESNQNLNWLYDNDGNAKWYLIEATDIEVALNNAGDASYATTYLPFSVSAAEGAELYTGELNGNVMNLTKSHTGVAAEQGIVLVGESSATKAVLTIGEGKATGKGLVGTLTPKDVEAKTVLTLGKSGSEVGFFAFTGTQIDANKAYVEKTAGASAVMINFGEVTGIENAVAPEAANAPLYDLSGRRVVKAVKGGLYIQNGKKFIAR